MNLSSLVALACSHSTKSPFVACQIRNFRCSTFIASEHSQSPSPLSLLLFEKDGYCAVYVDGSCLMNGRRGAIGGIGVWWANDHPWNVSSVLRGRRQTSGRAELQAACEALRIARHYKIERLRVFTDSVLVVKGASEWIFRWRLSNWTVPLQNRADWYELDELLRPHPSFIVDWRHVRGHSQFYGNEQAHTLATLGAKKATDIRAQNQKISLAYILKQVNSRLTPADLHQPLYCCCFFRNFTFSSIITKVSLNDSVSELSDVVCIPPWQFNANPNEAIVTLLNNKLANRVLTDVGLCICVWQVERVGDSHLLPGNPGYQVLVTFSALVFRPFVDEVLLGKIKSSSQTEGIQLSVTFFDDIQVPVDQLPTPSKWDDTRLAWYWEYSDSPDEITPKHKLYMNVGTTVRFRIVSERFVDKTPRPGGTALGSNGEKLGRSSSATSTADASVGDYNRLRAGELYGDDDANDTSKLPPYSITASLVDSGLGPLSWWSGG